MCGTGNFKTCTFFQNPFPIRCPYDLVIPADRAGSREAQGLLKVLSSRWLLDQLASLPGYDPARCGEHIATLPPSPSAPVP